MADLVRKARSAADRQAGEARAIALEGKQAERDLAELKHQIELHDQAVALLNSIGEEAQETAQHQIEALVTRALQVIFDNTLSFHLVRTVKASQVTVDFVLRSRNTSDSPMTDAVDTPVLDARGGGMAVVVAFVLRLVVLLLTPGARRVLFLDESFSHVSAEYEPRLAEFLREVADHGVQVVLVTHSDAYSDLADRKYRLRLDGGVTRVAESV